MALPQPVRVPPRARVCGEAQSLRARALEEEGQTKSQARRWSGRVPASSCLPRNFTESHSTRPLFEERVPPAVCACRLASAACVAAILGTRHSNHCMHLLYSLAPPNTLTPFHLSIQLSTHVCGGELAQLGGRCLTILSYPTQHLYRPQTFARSIGPSPRPLCAGLTTARARERTPRRESSTRNMWPCSYSALVFRSCTQLPVDRTAVRTAEAMTATPPTMRPPPCTHRCSLTSAAHYSIL